jgi:hypothetical protein
VVAWEVVVGAEVVVVWAWVDVDAAVVVCAELAGAAAAWPAFGSRPKKKTANIIPAKSATVSVRNAGNPRRPGYSGRSAGIKNAEISAKTMNAAPTRARPTLCPVERAASNTVGTYRTRRG